MSPKEIIDRKTFIKYINLIDSENINKYLCCIDYYTSNTRHDIYKISSYIFSHMKLKKITNIYNYFNVSMKQNIEKLDCYSNCRINKLPTWYNQEIEQDLASKEEQEEMEKLLKNE